MKSVFRRSWQSFPEEVCRKIYKLFEPHNRLHPPAKPVHDDFWIWVNPEE